MAKRESTEAFVSSMAAFLADAAVLFGAFWLAMWLRFESGLISLRHPAQTFDERMPLALLATAVFLLVFYFCEMYRRPQQGRFEDKIPRIVKAVLVSYLVYFAMESILRIDPGFSRKALVLSLFLVTTFVMLERYLIYRIEWNLARHMKKIQRVLIIGTDTIAVKLNEAIAHDPFMRSDIVGYLSTSGEPSPGISPDQVIGGVDDLVDAIRERELTQVILSDISLDRDTLVDLIVQCEKNLVEFKLVPDLFRILTSGVNIQEVNGIPIMGLSKWPLDYSFNRMRKRAFDIAGAVVGLVVFGPLMAIAAMLIKFSSPGPVLYSQTRYGEDGKSFTMHKLRTMNIDAEKDGPGWTTEDDPRRTAIGGILRKYNIDEMPQFWDVLMGDMSIVGPRPERPHYVEQFKEAINRYMVRHVSKPGITGWAQVNGLRGDTSIEERIKYDLYYLENWSLSLDFKIIMKTLTGGNDNAY